MVPSLLVPWYHGTLTHHHGTMTASTEAAFQDTNVFNVHVHFSVVVHLANSMTIFYYSFRDSQSDLKPINRKLEISDGANDRFLSRLNA